MKETTKCYCGHTTYCDCSPLEEPKQETIYEYTENYKPSFVDLTDILPKQETLEEAAEKLYPNRESFLDRFQDIERKAFTEGAKWQQEQDKNKYSEEDIREAFECGVAHITFEEWINKFKKK